MTVNGVCMTFLIGVTKSDFREGFSGSDCGGRSSLAGVAGAVSSHVGVRADREQCWCLPGSLSFSYLSFAFFSSVWDPTSRMVMPTCRISLVPQLVLSGIAHIDSQRI